MNQGDVVSVFIPPATVLGSANQTRLSDDTERKNTLYLSFVSDVPDSSSLENDPFRRVTNNGAVFSSPADPGCTGPDVFSFPPAQGGSAMWKVTEHTGSAAVPGQGTAHDTDGPATLYHSYPQNSEDLILR